MAHLSDDVKQEIENCKEAMEELLGQLAVLWEQQVELNEGGLKDDIIMKVTKTKKQIHGFVDEITKLIFPTRTSPDKPPARPAEPAEPAMGTN